MFGVVSLVRKAPSATGEFGDFINDSHVGRTFDVVAARSVLLQISNRIVLLDATFIRMIP